MVDISAIAGTVSALKGATDIAKAMMDLRDAQAVQTKVLELNSKILEAQRSAFAANEERTSLIARVSELEKELAEFKAWSAEKQRYELKQLHRGPFAYILREGEERGEELHALCTNCYQNGVKSFLQMSGDVNVHVRTWNCPACKMSVKGQWAKMADWIKKTRNPEPTKTS